MNVTRVGSLMCDGGQITFIPGPAKCRTVGKDYPRKYQLRASLVAQPERIRQECRRGSRSRGFNPGLARFPGEGNGNPLQYSCLENPTYRGAWRATGHGVTESNMTKQLSRPAPTHTHTPLCIVFWQMESSQKQKRLDTVQNTAASNNTVKARNFK